MAISKHSGKKTAVPTHRRKPQAKHCAPVHRPQPKVNEFTKVMEYYQMENLCKSFSGMLVSNHVQEVTDRMQRLSLDPFDTEYGYDVEMEDVEEKRVKVSLGWSAYSTQMQQQQQQIFSLGWESEEPMGNFVCNDGRRRPTTNTRNEKRFCRPI